MASRGHFCPQVSTPDKDKSPCQAGFYVVSEPYIVVSERGLEPPCPLRALAPQASASTYSATRTSALVSPPARMTIATSSRGCESPHHPPGRLLEPLDVRPPPVGIMVGEIAALRTRTDAAIDQLADDVGMAGVTRQVVLQVHEHVLEGHRVALRRPPGHMSLGIDGQRRDRRVGVGTGARPQSLDAGAGLVRQRPHVVVVLGVRAEALRRVGERTAHAVAEVARLHGRRMLQQAQQVGARRCHGASYVVVAQSLDLSLIHISEPTRLGMISYAVF